MRAIANIRLFEASTNMEGWLITILRNQFRSEWRWRSKEVEDVDGCYAGTLQVPAKQHGRLELEELRMALAKLPYDQRETLVLVAAAGFSYDEAAAAICGCAVGTIKSRLNRARVRLAELLLESVVES